MMMAFKNSSVKQILNFLNKPRNDDELLDEMPNLSFISQGESIFLLNRNTVVDLRDVTHDGLSPWSGNDLFGIRHTAKYDSFGVEFIDGKYERSIDKTTKVRVIRNVHPHYLNFRREIFYVVDDSNQLISNVYFIYKAEHDIHAEKLIPHQLLPSERKIMKEALSHRTTLDAKRFLQDRGLTVPVSKLSSLSRSVPDHLKTNVGRKAPVDFHSVNDRFILKPNDEELIEKPMLEFIDGSLRVRIIVGYPHAFQCFGSSLPTVEDLQHHRRNVDSLTDLPPHERLNSISSYLSSTNESGSLPMIGSSLMIDTTFSLASAEYVTVALGIADSFKSKSSHKNSSIILGYMIHSSKEAVDHDSFASFLNSLFLKYCPGKSLSLIIHDGEAAFAAYQFGEFLRSSILVRCDVHRLQNVKDAIKKDGLHDFELVKVKLFGKKIESDKGSVLQKGILNSLTRSDYDDRMINFISECEGDLKKWLLTNFNSLFDHNSFLVKLKAGWPVQYLTSNIIESKNAYLKKIIATKKPAQKILNDFLHLHKEEIEERIRAVGNHSGLLYTDFSVPFDQWKLWSSTQKRLTLAQFGLRNAIPVFLFDEVPNWTRPKKISEDALNGAVQNLKVHQSQTCSSHFFLISIKNEEECFRVVLQQNLLKCYSASCKRKVNYKFCVHTLVVVLTLPATTRSEIISTMDKKKNTLTCNDELRSQMRPEQGTKFLKRKGKQYSQNNGCRGFVGIMNSTLSSLEESLNDQL